MYRIGIIGVGRIAQTYFTVLRKIQGVEVAFLCDILPEQMTRAVKKFPDLLARTGCFASSDDALNHVGPVDTVVIATPLSSHFFLARQVLKRGVRVLLEKPGVGKMEELETLYALAEENETEFQTMFHFAFAPEVVRFLTLRDGLSRTFGPLRGFSCDFQDPGVRPKNEDGSEMAREDISTREHVGCYLDSGVNALSVLERVLTPTSELKNVSETWPGLDCVRVASHRAWYVPQSGNRNEEKKGPVVDTASITEYVAPGRGFSGVIRTDWEQGWNYKGTLLQFAYGTALLDHVEQTVVLTHFDTGRFVKIPCSDGTSRQEKEYENMFRHFFFTTESRTQTKQRDFRIHELLLEPEMV
ncbi:MAG: Gfo/Idh/MocA family oxidoreductase [Planctomycetia bacterium]|nr:Gfo/Idh/MocA family oxidoreductase [Planctomycetia bacterium]